MPGNYYFIEKENPNYTYNNNLNKDKRIKATPDSTVYYKNSQLKGNLRIEKVDNRTGKKLQGVEFKILNEDGSKYIKVKEADGKIIRAIEGVATLQGFEFTENEDDATIFRTNSEGIIELNIISQTNTSIKKFIVEETNNPLRAYYLEPNYIEWEGSGVKEELKEGKKTGRAEVTMISGQTITAKVKNTSMLTDLHIYKFNKKISTIKIPGVIF